MAARVTRVLRKSAELAHDVHKSQGMLAFNPITGREHEVSPVMNHPQFPGKKIVQCDDTGMQWTEPPPTAADLSQIYADVYNDAYGRDLSATAVIPDFVSRRAKAQGTFIRQHAPEGALTPSSRAVEVGAGWGELSREMSHMVGRVDCFELDPAAVDFINRHHHASGVQAHVGALEDCKHVVPEQSVDLIVSSMMLEHVPDPRGSVAEWRTRLADNGLLFIEVPNENPVPNWWGHHAEKPYWVGHLTFFSLKHLLCMLDGLGFRVLAGAGFDHPVAPFYVQPGDQQEYQLPADPADDAKPTTSSNPRVVRVLAQKTK